MRREGSGRRRERREGNGEGNKGEKWRRGRRGSPTVDPAIRIRPRNSMAFGKLSLNPFLRVSIYIHFITGAFDLGAKLLENA